ncbi:MAG: type ISP restriction/modification enzyme [Candidatus Binatia bacterium]
MLKQYLRSLFEVARRGDATEESFYSCLKGLIEAFAQSRGKRSVQVTPLPKKTEAGNPDFRVWDGKQHIVGYIEAKNLTEERLQLIETSDQLKRYRHTFPNLILTNFFEFRLYRNGELMDTVQIGRPFIVHRLKTVPPVEKETEFFNLLEKFFAFSLPRTYSANSLAVELAKRTRFLRDQVIAEELREEPERGTGFILGFYEAFQKYLIGTLTKEQFADLYAQTITYGLFAARTRAENSFNRRQAFHNIPPTIGILRDVFRFISLEDLPQQMEWIVDDIADVLAVADVKNILRERAGRDPIVHFYEPFLAEYDPKERERRGVYYTPEPVVSYIARSLHRILKDVFGRPDGFASNSVRVLDPAAGTCTFPAEAARLAVTEFSEKYGSGARTGLIRDHILNNFYAFELMMAPYAVGHLKIGFLFEELGHRLQKDERFQLYLTNTLEMEDLEQTPLPGMASLAEESHLAGKVKKETPILVILGNPPYSGHSANVGPWISDTIQTYYQVDGKPLGEKNPKWLQDDYVKFIRFAQWKIEQAGEGVLGFITNHSYLENPTFRGMRQSLMQSFEQIYVLDLHGSSLKKERCPDGSEDKNVFDIRQGVAISLFIKKPGLKRKVCHAELWGLRDEKYASLEINDIATSEWTVIHPKSPFYLFVPRDEALLDRYQRYSKVTEIFPLNGVGMTTARDNFVIDFDKATLLNRIRLFKKSKYEDENLHQFFSIPKKKGWSIRKAWNMLQEFSDGQLANCIFPVLYRPFDVRWIFYHDSVVWRTVKRIMGHMLRGENLGLIIPKRVELAGGWQHALAINLLVEHVAVSLKTIDYLFPLYLYPDSDKKDLLSPLGGPVKRRPNLDPSLLQGLKEAHGRMPTPEEVFHYIYAVLYSPTYRTKYAEFLKTDFPRVPFTQDRELFARMAHLGKSLVDLHLLRSPELDPPITRFQGSGDNKVEKQRYSEQEKRAYINKAQYFEGVEPEVWEYQIGGYQVLDKWLKDRKGRALSLEDVRHYCRVVTALSKTIDLQVEIDVAYQQVEGKILPLGSKK